jgi:hypothetical protein|tara:strand:- start:432 stop:752 length:321 start_codon:yes stop_codon:yes gene_type:complete
MKIWLKGGIIAIVIGFIGIIIQTIFLNYIDPFNVLIFLSGFSIPALLGYSLAPIFSNCIVSIKPDINTCTLTQQIPGFIIGLIIILVIYFGIGSFIGYIVGKIKSK